MAKKSVDMTVEEKLKTLFQLQTTLTGIDEKRALRGELPLEVQDLEDEIEGLNTREEKIRGEINDYDAAIVMKKGEIETAKVSLERYKKQLDEVRNNREYDTLTKEIEFQSLEIELCNKKIKEAQVKIEERKMDLKKVEEAIAERTQDLIHKRAELDEIMQETRESEEALKEQARELEERIEARLLQSFKRIRKGARNGLGLVSVTPRTETSPGGACGGCFAKIPPQRQLDVKMHKKIIVCEYCGRILIDPQLAGKKEYSEASEKKVRKTRASRKAAAEAPAETAE